jgi:hypothetical protein
MTGRVPSHVDSRIGPWLASASSDAVGEWPKFERLAVNIH